MLYLVRLVNSNKTWSLEPMPKIVDGEGGGGGRSRFSKLSSGKCQPDLKKRAQNFKKNLEQRFNVEQI